MLLGRFIVSRLAVVRGLFAAALLTSLACAPAQAAQFETSGVKLPEQVVVAGKPLQLNGAGVRYKAVFKVYTAALYLPARTSSAEEIVAAGAEPRRLHITMLRDIDSGEFGKLFYRGMEDNMDKGAFAKLIPGVLRMSQVLSEHKRLKEGEGFTIDWVPGTGTVLTIEGKPAEPFKEPAFFTALMRIWLGSKPPDWKLKDALLGQPPSS